MERGGRTVNLLGGGSRDAIDSRILITLARLRLGGAVERVAGHRMDEDDWLETPAQGSTSDPLVEQEYQRLASRYSDVSLVDLRPSCVF
jgi:hypothetical protein